MTKKSKKGKLDRIIDKWTSWFIVINLVSIISLWLSYSVTLVWLAQKDIAYGISPYYLLASGRISNTEIFNVFGYVVAWFQFLVWLILIIGFMATFRFIVTLHEYWQMKDFGYYYSKNRFLARIDAIVLLATSLIVIWIGYISYYQVEYPLVIIGYGWWLLVIFIIVYYTPILLMQMQILIPIKE